jgi:tetratricopeptide (TPR) repeat protein
VRLVAVGVGLIFFIFWRSQVHLLGDGYLMLRELAMLVNRTGNEPLALWLVAKLYEFGAGFGAEAVYRSYSYAAGVGYLLLAFPTAAALSDAKEGRWLVLGFLLTAGYIQVFCGYVETYPLLFPGVLLYLLAGLYLLRKRWPLWVLSGGLAVLMTYHFIAITLGPSLVVLAWLGWRRGHVAGWASVMGGLALGPVIALLILYSVGVDLFAYATGLRGGHLLPLWATPDSSQAYRLLSPEHLLDLANQQMLAAPAVVMVLLGVRGALRRGWSDERIFLGAAGLMPLLFTLLANPEIGVFRDWDVLAFPALPLGLWAACAVLEKGGARQGVLVCGAAALHTLAWIGVNADESAAVGRFAVMLEQGHLSRHGRAYGWETLGSYYRQRGQREEALRAFVQAAEADPHNLRRRETIAREQLALGRPDEAGRVLEEALELEEETPHLWDLLGTVYAAQERYTESISAHRRALALQGRDGIYWYNLANIHLRSGSADEALAAYDRAMDLGVRGPELRYNAGLAHEARGEWQAARVSYEAALGIDSAYAPAQLRLEQLREKSGVK